VFWWLLPCLL